MDAETLETTEETRQETLVALARVWGEPVRERCEPLARARTAHGDDPALGPLLCRLLALDLLEGGGTEDAVSAELVRAAEIEQEAGWLLAASHSRHQLALLTSSRGRLEALPRYYQESLGTLREQQNDRGMGLCLRSLGELTLREARFDVTRTCWERADRALAAEDVPEARGPREWLGLLAILEAEAS